MSVVTPTILSDSKELDYSFELISIEVIKEVNRIPFAQIILIDGDVAQQKFPVADSDFFKAGKEIEIKLRYESDTAKEATVFKGVVVKLNIESSLRGSQLTVTLKDKTVVLTGGRKSQIFREKSDDEIIQEIVEMAGLEAGSLEKAKTKHLELVQYNVTDWDFILLRAQFNGQLLHVDDGVLSTIAPKLTGEAELTFEYGIDEIYSFEIEANGETQIAEIESMGWDLKEQKLTPAVTSKAVDLYESGATAEDAAESIGMVNQVYLHPVPLEDGDLQAWSDGLLAHSRLAFVRGQIKVPGIESIKPTGLIELAGVGEQFSGKTIITGIRHLVDLNGWETAIQFGLSQDLFAEQTRVQPPPAGGQLAAIHGLQIGVVAPFEEDPNKELRIKVWLPALVAEKNTVWARLALPDAGLERGLLIWPEPGDEVVVGFFNNDPRHPVILGSMFSSKNSQPASLEIPTEKNIKKGFVTKSGSTIEFLDDEKSSILIQTPAENKIRLDDDGELIEIIDQHGNSIVLSADGIKLASAGDLTIEASGDVAIVGSTVGIS